MKAVSIILFILGCLMEVLAVISYFHFPNVPYMVAGLLFALIGVAFFGFGFYMRRKAYPKIH
jgi:hypothetical protein